MTWVSYNVVTYLFKTSCLLIEIDTEGTIPPDTDEPQEMGDPSIEVCDGHCHYDWEKKIICFF